MLTAVVVGLLAVGMGTPAIAAAPTVERVVFSAYSGSQNRGNHQQDIYVADADSKNVQRLTNDKFRDVEPRWSPDGTQIAWSSKRDGQGSYDIWVMDADGGNARKVTDESNGVGSQDQKSPAWSPDGTQILYMEWNRWDGDYDLWIMNVADGSIVRKVSDKSQYGNYDDYWGSFSPHGTHIIFDSNRGGEYQVWRVDVYGGNPVKLTDTPVNIPWRGEFSDASEYSPDGTQVVYRSTREGGELGSYSIWVMDGDGANPRKLTGNNHRHNDSMATWSSDGTRIAFQSVGRTEGGNSEIFIVDAADGGNLHRLNDRSVDSNWIGIFEMADPDMWGPS